MSERTLQDRVALVTGAGGGVGRGIALALAAAGARVVIAARRAATGEETAALIRAESGTALAVETDVARRSDVDRAVARTVEAYGGLDIMIHNASSGLSGVPAQLQDITVQTWSEQLAVGMDGSLHCAQAAFPHLKASGRGRYIGLNSAFGLHGAGMNPAYAAGKGALRGFIKALAREWGPHGITVNAIAPASSTDASDAFFEQNLPLKEAYLRNFPMRRMGRPREDIGGAVVAICGEGFGYVSGQTLFVDGGLMTVL
jgi:3-oxoacyl-[acyl-carrier protein] reductase